jgi:hypothetical protein
MYSSAKTSAGKKTQEFPVTANPATTKLARPRLVRKTLNQLYCHRGKEEKSRVSMSFPGTIGISNNTFQTSKVATAVVSKFSIILFLQY